MDIIYGLIVGVHMVGFAAIMVGYYFSWSASRGNRPMFPGQVMVIGARTQIITGLIIVGLGSTLVDEDYNYIQITAKLLVALAVAWLVEKGAAQGRRHEYVQPKLVHAAGLLAIANALMASLW